MLAPAQSEAEQYLRLRTWNQKALRDPLDWWRFGVPRLKDAFRLFTGPKPINELHMRKPNRSGGTTTLATWLVACCQKRESLDGVAVPQWRGKVEACQFVLDYKRQLLSVQPAYERALGHWPHKARYSGSALSDLRIMPVGGDPEDLRQWSVLHFLSEDNPNAAIGIRSDVSGFDEPPPLPILQEMRKAGHAGRRSIRLIAETPEHMRQWMPLFKDYGDTPRNCIRRVDEWRAEVRWSLDEVADWVLAPEEKREMREAYWDVGTGEPRDLLAAARWHGDYTNVEGSTPWGRDGLLTLTEMLSECRPAEIQEFRVPQEVNEAGETGTIASVPVQVWAPPKAGSKYYIAIDPASGMDDGKHHEAALHVSEWGSCDLVARWAGYLAPYTLGVLGALLARQYNQALCDIEMQDRWGVNVARGFESARFGRMAHEKRELRPGEWANEPGFRQDKNSKAIQIGQIQEWLGARKGGRIYGRCPSVEVIQNLIAAELDDREMVVAGPGLEHGHDMVLRGQTFRIALARHNKAIPELAQPTPSPEARLVALIRGDADPFRGPRPSPPRYRQAPRIR